MSKRILIANWKMHLTLPAARLLAADIVNRTWAELVYPPRMIIAPPFPFIPAVHEVLSASYTFAVAAQNVHQAPEGAFTGEVSAEMLRSCGATYALVGHSERRQHYNEDNELLAQKVQALLDAGVVPIYCVGETLEEREQGRTLHVIHTQIEKGLFGLPADQVDKIFIAYEPVWAIGTGKTATAEQAQDVHASIRHLLAEQYSDHIAKGIPILYGGSVKPQNAERLFAKADIDGGLVGGASLNARDFVAIAAAFPDEQ